MFGSPKQIKLVVLVGLFVTTTSPVEAGFITVSDRAALGGNDLVDWSTAPPGLDNPGNQFAMTSLGGLPIEVQLIAPEALQMGIQVSPGGPGEFPAGTYYITGAGSSGGTFFPGQRILELRFDEAVQGFGADIDPDFRFFGSGIFNFVSIEAYGSAGQLVGSSSISVSDPALNGQPVFLGGLSDEANITRVNFRIVSFNGATGLLSAASGNVSGVSLVSPSSAAVPEPASLVLLGWGAAGLLVSHRWTARRKVVHRPSVFCGANST